MVPGGSDQMPTEDTPQTALLVAMPWPVRGHRACLVGVWTKTNSFKPSRKYRKDALAMRLSGVFNVAPSACCAGANTRMPSGSS